MRISSITLLLAVTTLLVVAAVAACSSKTTDGQPLDPSTATLEDVLQHARAAMGDVTTYRTRETSVSRDSNNETSVPYRGFSEFQSHDHYRFGNGSPEDEGGYYFENLVSGTQSFIRKSDPEWQEQEPIFDRGEPVSTADNLISYLDADGIELMSSDEVTDDGTKVYRLGTIENYDQLLVETSGQTGDPAWGVHTRTTSMLIDQESFRIVARVFDKLYKNSFYDKSSSDPRTNTEWAQTIYTVQIYDYNEPIVIEAPAEYVPWSDSATISSELDTTGSLVQ